MRTYGALLKSLINITNSKLSTLADIIGYDISYISKWCNKSYLPSAKAAPAINDALSGYFAHELIQHGDISSFEEEFSMNVTVDTLEKTIYNLLKDSYKGSCKEHNNDYPKETSQARVLTQRDEIIEYFSTEFIELLQSYNEELDILCTFDISLLSDELYPKLFQWKMPPYEINVKVGLDPKRLRNNNYSNLKNLYYFMSSSYITLDFYENNLISNMNTLVIKNHLAIIASLNQYNRFTAAVIISNPEKVNQIYNRTLSAFRSSNILMHATEPRQFYRFGYGSDFYARNSFQILLTRGFEYLLPEQCWDSIINQAKKRDNNPLMAKLASQLHITWEEIFEKGKVDFFVLKSSIMKYIEDGIIIFTDIVYQMSPEERKLHIENVLNITKKNPNINFYVIDDEYLPGVDNFLRFSVFNNRKKLFLKRPDKYITDSGPYFYSVMSDEIIQITSEFFDSLRTQSYCYKFDHDALEAFMEKYSSLVYRTIDLSVPVQL